MAGSVCSNQPATVLCMPSFSAAVSTIFSAHCRLMTRSSAGTLRSRTSTYPCKLAGISSVNSGRRVKPHKYVVMKNRAPSATNPSDQGIDFPNTSRASSSTHIQIAAHATTKSSQKPPSQITLSTASAGSIQPFFPTVRSPESAASYFSIGLLTDFLQIYPTFPGKATPHSPAPLAIINV